MPGRDLFERPMAQEMLGRLYGEMRSLAARAMDRERRGHALDPTALVNGAVLRLSAQAPPADMANDLR